MSLADPRTVGPRIRMMMPHLTPLEGRVVEMILGRRDFDETTSLKAVAEDAGVSEAMVVKIAKKLGFAGFKDFRTSVVGYNGLPTAELHQELSPDDSGVEIAQKVFRTSIHALERRSRSSTRKHSRRRLILSSPHVSAISTASAARPRSPAT